VVSEPVRSVVRIFEDLWISPAEGPEFDDDASGSGHYAEQAPRRLSDRPRERRGPTTG
jgi:hypothetical protein